VEPGGVRRTYGEQVGFGGIIFVAILTLWGLYLVPVLVKERTARLDNRSGERSSSTLRVLQRPPAQRPSRRVVLTVGRPLVSDDLPARPTRDLAVALLAEARRARLGVRLRGAAALLGVVGLLVAVLGTAAGVFPGWTLALAGSWLIGVLAAGAVAAAVRRREVAPTARVNSLPPRAYRVATEVFDDRAVRSTATESALLPAVRSSAAIGAVTSDLSPAAVPMATDAPREQAATWTPVEVPVPVYASKPVSRRPPALPWSMPPAAFPAEQAAPTEQAAPSEVAAQHHLGEADEPERRSAAG